MLVIASIILIPLGLIMLLKPKVFYEITESWKSYTNADPSNFYIITTRIGGAMFLIIGLVAFVLLIIG